MTPGGNSETFGAAPRLPGHILKARCVFPASQLQPASATILPRAVGKLICPKVKSRALPVAASATQSAVAVGEVVVNARFFPSRDQSRSRILPVNPDPVTWRARPVVGSRIPTDIGPFETVVGGSRSPTVDHAVDPM